MSSIAYKTNVDVTIDTDVVVIGGGPSGFAAAVASARNGAKTLLIEESAMLGGMSTSALVGPFSTCYDSEAEEQIVKGIFDELCTRLENMGGAIHPSKVMGSTPYSSYHKRSFDHVTPYLSEYVALCMDEMCEEAGVDILLFTKVCDTIVSESGKIDYLILSQKEGLSAAKAKLYIDCTGDADVAYKAGVPFTKGDDRGAMQPGTLFFEVGNIDRDKYLEQLESQKETLDISFQNCYSWYVSDARKAGKWNIECNEIENYEQNIPGRFKINTSRIMNVDGTSSKSMTIAQMEGRRQVQQIVSFMKEYLPGCENMQVLQIASRIGIRETRHIQGKYTLTVEDVMHRAIFDDQICVYGYAVDLHSPDGSAGVFSPVDRYYSIPYRCLQPVGCDNLLVAGRSISGTSMAASSYRVMPCAMALGQAAGTAASIIIKEKLENTDVNVKELQKILVEQNVVLKNE